MILPRLLNVPFFPATSNPMFISLSLSLFLQVVESLALEDTDIKSEHIALIKELIKKEDLEEARQVVVKDTTSSS